MNVVEQKLCLELRNGSRNFTGMFETEMGVKERKGLR